MEQTEKKNAVQFLRSLQSADVSLTPFHWQRNTGKPLLQRPPYNTMHNRRFSVTLLFTSPFLPEAGIKRLVPYASASRSANSEVQEEQI